MALDTTRRVTNFTTNESPAHPQEGRAETLQRSEERADFEPSVSSPPTGLLSLIDAESPFSGQSPAPFTAPPSPAPSSSKPSAVQEPMFGFITPSSSTALLPAISRHPIATESDNTAASSRTRYRQKDENEVRQRLEALVRQYGPEHLATLDTLFRLGIILREQGRFRAAEVAFRQVIEGRQKVFGAAHPSTIEGVSLGGVRGSLLS